MVVIRIRRRRKRRRRRRMCNGLVRLSVY